MFLSLLKNHTSYKQNPISGRKESIQQNMTYLDPQLRNLSNEYKTIASLADSRVKIKTWVPETLSCRLCKTYIHQIGFI